MDAKEGIRAKVGDFGIYLVKTDFTALRPESWITGSVIMIFLQHAKQAAMDRTRTVSALGVQLQHTFLATADLFDSMCTDQQMTKRVNEWWTDKIIVPVNIGNTHWAAAIIKPKDLSFRFYDSMPSKEEHGVVPGVDFPELPGNSGPIPGEPGARSGFLKFCITSKILTEYGAATLELTRSTE
ncbi:hypothetical protein V8E36_002781 [Tilletia maclaganii]